MVARNVRGVGSADLRQKDIRCDWWTVTQLADHYGLAARTIYAAIARGELVAHRFGGRRRGIRIADADRLAWEAESREAGSSSASRPPAAGPRPRPLVAKHFPT